MKNSHHYRWEYLLRAEIDEARMATQLETYLTLQEAADKYKISIVQALLADLLTINLRYAILNAGKNVRQI